MQQPKLTQNHVLSTAKPSALHVQAPKQSGRHAHNSSCETLHCTARNSCQPRSPAMRIGACCTTAARNSCTQQLHITAAHNSTHQLPTTRTLDADGRLAECQLLKAHLFDDGRRAVHLHNRLHNVLRISRQKGKGFAVFLDKCKLQLQVGGVAGMVDRTRQQRQSRATALTGAHSSAATFKTTL